MIFLISNVYESEWLNRNESIRQNRFGASVWKPRGAESESAVIPGRIIITFADLAPLMYPRLPADFKLLTA